MRNEMASKAQFSRELSGFPWLPFYSVAPLDMTDSSFEAGCDPYAEQRRFSGLVLDGGSNDGCVRLDSPSHF
jgi:hypothetical protein